MERLDSEMNRIHYVKVNQATDGLENDRMNSKRRETILRETNIFDILTKYEALTQSEKIATSQYHLLEIGTLTKKSNLKTIKAINFDFHTKSKDEPFMESSDSSGRLIVYQSALDSFEELTKGIGQKWSPSWTK